MSEDPTEGPRRRMVAEINHAPGSCEDLEARYGQVWNTEQLWEDFEVKGFMAPFVVVVRRSDNKKGTLTFQHHERFNFDWKAYDD